MRLPVVLLLAVASGGCHLVFGAGTPDTIDAPDDVPVDAPVDAPDPTVEIGCADGTREAFDLAEEPAIAGCSGGWSVAGVAAARTMCTGAGNDATDPMGIGCSIADLCAPGWHLCTGKVDVAAHMSDDGRCRWEAAQSLERVFFATAQPGSYARCVDQGTDDVFGCGSLGAVPDGTSDCAPLARASGNLCGGLTVGGWLCGQNFLGEAEVVTKTGTLGGGALCCRDPAES